MSDADVHVDRVSAVRSTISDLLNQLAALRPLDEPSLAAGLASPAPAAVHQAAIGSMLLLAQHGPLLMSALRDHVLLEHVIDPSWGALIDVVLPQPVLDANPDASIRAQIEASIRFMRENPDYGLLPEGEASAG